MAGNHPQAWKCRREIPDPQIRDAADQFEEARKILRMQPPGTGVVLPMKNAAAMAIELYLKCLAAEVIHVPESANSQGSLVYAQASTRGHKFTKMFCRIDEDIRSQLEAVYVEATDRELEHDLSTIEDALVVTRYPYEPGKDASRISLQTLASISEFLRKFVASLEPRETIQWKDESSSSVTYQ